MGVGGKRGLVKEKRGPSGVKVALQIPHIILNKSVVLLSHENGHIQNPPSADGRINPTRPIQAMTAQVADTTDYKNNLSWKLQKIVASVGLVGFSLRYTRLPNSIRKLSYHP